MTVQFFNILPSFGRIEMEILGIFAFERAPIYTLLGGLKLETYIYLETPEIVE